MEHAAEKIVPKLLNLKQNVARISLRMMLTTFNDDTDLLKKVITGDTHGWISMTLRQKPNYPNKSVEKSQDGKTHAKFGQMWRFCSLFASIAMAWSVMKSCHKVVRWIRNTNLKLCADCEKKFVRNAQICGRTNHWFCIMITHELMNQYLCVSNPVSKIVFTGLSSRWLFPLNKTEDTSEKKAIEEMKEKFKRYQKARFRSARSVISLLYLLGFIF